MPRRLFSTSVCPTVRPLKLVAQHSCVEQLTELLHGLPVCMMCPIKPLRRALFPTPVAAVRCTVAFAETSCITRV